MKKLISLLLAFVGALSMMAAQPTIEFDTKSHDFGTIKEADGSVSCEFAFTNTGSEPIVIISANASCGCTRPEYPKKPIAPGKTDKIKVTYNPMGRPGEFNKTIKVRTNAQGKKSISLKINGVVIPNSTEK